MNRTRGRDSLAIFELAVTRHVLTRFFSHCVGTPFTRLTDSEWRGRSFEPQADRASIINSEKLLLVYPEMDRILNPSICHRMAKPLTICSNYQRS
jgi:hypothetical protein